MGASGLSVPLLSGFLGSPDLHPLFGLPPVVLDTGRVSVNFQTGLTELQSDSIRLSSFSSLSRCILVAPVHHSIRLSDALEIFYPFPSPVVVPLTPAANFPTDLVPATSLFKLGYPRIGCTHRVLLRSANSFNNSR
jgi:hypothetical protein